MSGYAEIYEKFKPMLEALFTCLKANLAKHFPEIDADVVMENCTKRFKKVLAEMDFIGEDNPLLQNLFGAAYEMGFYAELEALDIALNDISVINQKALADFVKTNMPPDVARFMKETALSAQFLQAAASKSQKEQYPADWVYICELPGEDDSFDIGVTYTKCGIVHLFKKYGYERFLPYICLNDYPMYGCMGVPFKRTATLGNGAEYCDFRYYFNGCGMPICVTEPEKLEEFKKA